MKKRLVLVLALLVAGCASYERLEPFELDFASKGKIQLNTQDLRIVDKTKNTPQWDPYVGHLFTPSIAEAVNRLADQRLQTVGQIGHATLTIKDANVMKQPETVSSDLLSLFERQQAARYVGRVEVSLETQAPDGNVAIATAYATRYVTLPEAPTTGEMREAYKKLLNGLMDDLNENLEKAIRQHLSRFVHDGAEPSAALGLAPSPSPTSPSLLPAP